MFTPHLLSTVHKSDSCSSPVIIQSNEPFTGIPINSTPDYVCYVMIPDHNHNIIKRRSPHPQRNPTVHGWQNIQRMCKINTFPHWSLLKEKKPRLRRKRNLGLVLSSRWIWGLFIARTKTTEETLWSRSDLEFVIQEFQIDDFDWSIAFIHSSFHSTVHRWIYPFVADAFIIVLFFSEYIDLAVG